ncbi:ABC transporter substrate-binding protein [bacterium]|nr:ABC transporter substrate-binding protein [bacterium]
MKTIKILALVMIVLLSGCEKWNFAKEETIKIGAIIFLTGPQSATGENVLRGLKMSCEMINKKGGVAGKKIELLIEDSKDSPKDAINAFHKLSSKGVAAMIVSGDVINANIAPIATREKIPVLAVVAEAGNIPSLSDYVFRAWVSDNELVKKLVDYIAKNTQLKNAAVIAVNNEFGDSTIANFTEYYEGFGGNVCAVDRYGISDIDVRAQVLKCMESKPDAFFVSGFGVGFGSALNQIRESGFKGMLFSSIMMSLSYYQDQTKKSNEGVIYSGTAFSQDSKEPLAVEFIKGYTDRYHVAPDFTSAFAFESLNILARAIELGGVSREGIKNAMLNLGTMDSVFGSISYDASKEFNLPLKIWQMKNGQPVIIEQ